MRLDEFQIGREFLLEDVTYRCTDIGTRTVSAIRIGPVDRTTLVDGLQVTETITREQAEVDGWFDGPPYAVVETHFDEDDIVACEPAPVAPAPTGFR